MPSSVIFYHLLGMVSIKCHITSKPKYTQSYFDVLTMWFLPMWQGTTLFIMVSLGKTFRCYYKQPSLRAGAHTMNLLQSTRTQFCNLNTFICTDRMNFDHWVWKLILRMWCSTIVLIKGVEPCLDVWCCQWVHSDGEVLLYASQT